MRKNGEIRVYMLKCHSCISVHLRQNIPFLKNWIELVIRKANYVISNKISRICYKCRNHKMSVMGEAMGNGNVICEPMHDKFI